MKWKILFGLYVVNTILATLAIPSYPEISAFDLAHLLLYYSMAVPLFLLAFDKQYLNGEVWQYHFILVSGATLLYIFAFRIGGIPRFGQVSALDASLIVELVFAVPFLLGLYFHQKRYVNETALS